MLIILTRKSNKKVSIFLIHSLAGKAITTRKGFADFINIPVLKSLRPEVRLKNLLWVIEQTIAVNKCKDLGLADVLFILRSSKTTTYFH